MLTILTIFYISVTLQSLFFILGFSRFFLYKKREKAGETLPSVSVVVCAHNEGANLKTLVPKLLKQQYKSFEIIIVNDRSSDDTARFLQIQELKNDILKVVNIHEVPSGKNGKKHAIMAGITSANHDVILLTDADCFPASDFWIQEMATRFGQNTEFVLGYSQYIKGKGLLNTFIRYETLYTAIQYLTMASLGRPYMGVGRNLAYKKTFFLSKGGFEGFWHKVGGDDDLFINQYAKNDNTRVCISPNALILSVPKKNLRSFFYQKVRHLTIGKSYKYKDKFIIGCLLMSHLLFWAGFILLSIEGISTPNIMLCLLLRMCILYATFSLAAKKLGDTFNILPLAQLDFLFTFYYLSVGIVALFTKKIKWN